MTKTVLMTGATGYLGGPTARALAAAGHELRLLVRDPRRLDPDLARRADVRIGDLEDLPSLIDAASGTDTIMHVAGLASEWVPDDDAFERINVTGTRHVLEAARTTGVPRVIATSSVMALGPTDGLGEGHEDTPPPARMGFLPYMVTKRRALRLCRQARTPDLSVTVTFPGALYGPGPLTQGNYICEVMEALCTGRYPCLPKMRGQRWCLAHVEDVALGHLLALEKGNPNGEYILGGENVTFDRMLQHLQAGLALKRLPPRIPPSLMLVGLKALGFAHALLATRPPLTFGGGQALIRDWAFSSRRAHHHLGYTHRPFNEAFPEFVLWYRELIAHPTTAPTTPAH